MIRTPPADPLPERLAALHRELEALIAELAPVAMAVERVLFQVNTRTAMSVGQASGLALASAARAGVPVVQYSPNEVKLAVAGDGGAGKAEVQHMVTRLLSLAAGPAPARRRRRARARAVPLLAGAAPRPSAATSPAAPDRLERRRSPRPVAKEKATR